MDSASGTVPLDCACVIVGDAYSWQYVTTLYNMLTRHVSRPVTLHVYTEADRPVPDHMVKHSLTPWRVNKPWWYKMQLFDSVHHSGPMLYFDLDVVIVDSIDWIWQLPLDRFWAVQDFKYLWRPTWPGLNTSVMWWDTSLTQSLWTEFNSQGPAQVAARYPGDQDYVTARLPQSQQARLDHTRVVSWRWQALDGGYDPAARQHCQPGTGTRIDPGVSVLVCHGQPKPHQVSDTVIVQHWK